MTKKRVQLDAFVIGAFIIFTGVLVFMFPYLYVENQFLRNICAVVGFVLIILGALLRMSGRGYKRFASQQSSSLVTGGPYQLVRNPMYLGTFLIGVGFMFPLFPLWTIAIFSAVFYLRFVIQIRKEQQFLLKSFGSSYEEYCRKVPAFIPNLRSLRSVTFNSVFPKKYLWTTQEKYCLFYWPAINLSVWFLQQEIFWKGMTIIPVVFDALFALMLLFWMIVSVDEED
jgi:protein-S-isoprenylcysteine O-methyltransferase Ste14